MAAIKRVWIGWVLLILCGCNLPANQTPTQGVNLLETIQALSTLVAQQTQPPPTPGQPASPIPQVADSTTTLTPTLTSPTPTLTLTAAAPTNTPPSGSTFSTLTPIVHTLIPGEPGWVERWFLDTNSSLTAADQRAPGGDDFSRNIFERPFTALDMVYRPDLDINKAEITSDANFIYVTITLNGLNPKTGNIHGWYGVELDTDLDGRGNFLIKAVNPQSTAWKMENVTATKDSGKKVGGARPMLSDPSTGYIGYDQVIFSVNNLADPDAAWARISPKGSAIVDLAFKRSLIGGADKFLWSVWADDGVKNPGLFDYNDHFTLKEAGSPYKDADYPLKALALVDNTCRESYHFTPTTDIPGLCSPPKNQDAKQTGQTDPVPGGGSFGVLTTDLAVVSIFLSSLPAGDLMFRLQNNGPAALNDVKVKVNCSTIIYSYKDGSEIGGYKNVKEVSLNLAVGQSMDVKTALYLDPQLGRYQATCYYEPNFKDPVASNDSLTVSIPAPP